MKMTKNEFKQYMKDCAARVWTDSSYNMEKYHADLDAVEIIPLDLKKFNLDTEIEEWINSFFEEEDTDSKGNYMLRGFTRNEGMEMTYLNLSYGDYANAYSFYAYNDKDRLIYTYCEGDTTLTLFETDEAYQKEKQETRAWYKEAYA